MSISLRAAALEDYPAINDLEATLADRETDRRASFDAVLADPDHDLIVAEADGAVVGLAHLMTYHDLSHGALAGQVLGLVVQEDHRGRGIGRALLNDLCRIATRRGIVEFHINTEPDNAIAQRLYRSIGAEVIGVQMEIELPCDRE